MLFSDLNFCGAFHTMHITDSLLSLNNIINNYYYFVSMVTITLYCACLHDADLRYVLRMRTSARAIQTKFKQSGHVLELCSGGMFFAVGGEWLVAIL